MIMDKLKIAAEKKSPICIGLDTELSYLPKSLLQKDIALSEKLFLFNKEIIDATEDLAACFKVQIAFYEALGMEGLLAYKNTLAYLKRQGLLSIGDIKRGDIQSTQAKYVEGHLRGDFEADMVTLSAYMGEDALSPFYEDLKRGDKGVFVLLHTSNPSAGDLQNLQAGEKKVYEHMGDLLEKWGAPFIGEEGFSAIGAVAGLTYPKEFALLSKRYPKMFFLIPGYGAQGGKGEDLQQVFRDGIHGVVNSSRGIITAHLHKPEGEHFAIHCREKALAMKEDLCRW